MRFALPLLVRIVSFSHSDGNQGHGPGFGFDRPPGRRPARLRRGGLVGDRPAPGGPGSQCHRRRGARPRAGRGRHGPHDSRRGIGHRRGPGRAARRPGPDPGRSGGLRAGARPPRRPAGPARNRAGRTRARLCVARVGGPGRARGGSHPRPPARRGGRRAARERRPERGPMLHQRAARPALVPGRGILAPLPVDAGHPAIQPDQPDPGPRLQLPVARDRRVLLLRLSVPGRRARLWRAGPGG
jgi:hypothetical protein